jgi:hypothetical protein
MTRKLTPEQLWGKREADDNERFFRSWIHRPLNDQVSGAEPQSFEIAPGLFTIRRDWEYLSLFCSRCGFFDNYCSWDKRLSVAGPGHRELNRWLCQRCAPEFEAWRREKPADVHITAWLDLPDGGLAAWMERRAAGVCLTKLSEDGAATAA